MTATTKADIKRTYEPASAAYFPSFIPRWNEREKKESPFTIFHKTREQMKSTAQQALHEKSFVPPSSSCYNSSLSFYSPFTISFLQILSQVSNQVPANSDSIEEKWEKNIHVQKKKIK